MRRGLAIAAVALLTSACTAPPHETAPDAQRQASPRETAIPQPRKVVDGTPHPSPRVERTARRVATRFLAAYLRFTYGQATRNRAVHTLVLQPPSVPMSVRHLHPPIVRLDLEWAGPTRVTVLATINDGRTAYPVAIRLVGQRAGFRVVALEP